MTADKPRFTKLLFPIDDIESVPGETDFLYWKISEETEEMARECDSLFFDTYND